MSATPRPVPIPSPALPVVRVKARDALLSGLAQGSALPDGRTLDAEAALLLVVAGQAVVIGGSYNRLLKTLDYARWQLLAAAPELERVREYPPELFDENGALADDVDEDEDLVDALRCPHCGALTFAGDVTGLLLVEGGERTVPAGYWQGDAGASGIVTARREDPGMQTDHWECATCERPVNLPDGTRAL